MKLTSLTLITLLLYGCQSAPKLASTNREPQSAKLSAREIGDLDRKFAERFSNPAVLAEFSEELKAELARRVRTFPRVVSVYHYSTRGENGLDAPRGESAATAYTTPLELNPPEAITYYRANAESFETDDSSSQVGAGIYAAIDPVQSETYAGKPWVLLEIRVPMGAKYLDLRPSETLTFSQAFASQWLSYTSRSGDHHYLDFKSILLVPTFRTQVAAVLRSLKIDAMAYDWIKTTTSLCGQANFSQRTSFNFINPNFLDTPERFRVYVQEVESSPSSEKLRAYNRIYDLIQASSLEFASIASDASSSETPITRVFWPLGANRIRVLTHPWANQLRRRSLLEILAKDPAEVEKRYAIFLNPLQNPYASEKLELDLTKLSKKTEESFGHVYTTYVYDPLNDLKETDPKVYSKRVAEIQSSTFGCSPKHPQENVTPTL